MVKDFTERKRERAAEDVRSRQDHADADDGSKRTRLSFWTGL
jgi:hypothetical protein